MSQFFLKPLFFSVVICSGLVFRVCNADICETVKPTVLLNINVSNQGRQFLVDTGQKIAIAIASPLSDNDTTVIVSLVIKPISDLTQIAFESNAALYVTAHQATTFNIIKPALPPTKVTCGGAYSFNGVQINGENTGLDGYITIYFKAPSSSTKPIVTGLAEYIYDVAKGKSTDPVPTNYYTLNPFETLAIPKFNSAVWVFIADNVSNGMIFPINILKPISPSTSVSNSATVSLDTQSVFQVSRYLAVNLDASEQTTVHFDLTKNAFVYGSY